MTTVTATTGINPLVQPLNTGEEEQRVANVTRNVEDNVVARAPEATDETSPRNNSQSTTQPQEELNRRDDPELQAQRQQLAEQNRTNNDDNEGTTLQPAPEESVTVTLSEPDQQPQAPALSREDLIAREDRENPNNQQAATEPEVEPQPDTAAQNTNGQGPAQRNDLTDGDNLRAAQAENNAELERARAASAEASQSRVETPPEPPAETEEPNFNTSLAELDDEETAPNPRVASFLEQNAEQRVGVNLNAIA